MEHRAGTGSTSLQDGAVVEPVKAADHEDLVRLMDLCLRSRSPWSVEQDLPLLAGRHAGALRLLVRRRGRITAHAGLYVHRYHLLDVELAVGVIGGVATHPGHRGRGYGSAVVRALLDELPALGVDLAVLWTDRESFYRRLGFVRAGQELVHAVTAGLLPAPAGSLRVRPAHRRDLPAMSELHDRELAGTSRRQAEWEAAWSLPATHFYILEDRGTVLAYGVLGKGTDLEGCLHEWGGGEKHLPDLCSGILALTGHPRIFVMTPPWKQDAVQAMRAHGHEPRYGALGMLHAPDPPGLATRLGLPSQAASWDHDTLLLSAFGVPDGGPPGLIPPLPFYLFGLDSM